MIKKTLFSILVLLNYVSIHTAEQASQGNQVQLDYDLECALASGKPPSKIRALLDRGASPVQRRDHSLKYLLKFGKIHEQQHPDERQRIRGYTAQVAELLFESAQKNKCTKTFLNGDPSSPVNYLSRSAFEASLSPLIWSLEADNEAVLTLLFQWRARIPDEPHRTSSFLTKAITRSSLPLVASLLELEQDGIDVNEICMEETPLEETPFATALIEGKTDIAVRLIEWGADVALSHYLLDFHSFASGTKHLRLVLEEDILPVARRNKAHVLTALVEASSPRLSTEQAAVIAPMIVDMNYHPSFH